MASTCLAHKITATHDMQKPLSRNYFTSLIYRFSLKRNWEKGKTHLRIPATTDGGRSPKHAASSYQTRRRRNNHRSFPLSPSAPWKFSTDTRFSLTRADKLTFFFLPKLTTTQALLLTAPIHSGNIGKRFSGGRWGRKKRRECWVGHSPKFIFLD